MIHSAKLVDPDFNEILFSVRDIQTVLHSPALVTGLPSAKGPVAVFAAGRQQSDLSLVEEQSVREILTLRDVGDVTSAVVVDNRRLDNIAVTDQGKTLIIPRHLLIGSVSRLTVQPATRQDLAATGRDYGLLQAQPLASLPNGQDQVWYNQDQMTAKQAAAVFAQLKTTMKPQELAQIRQLQVVSGVSTLDRLAVATRS